MRFKQGRRAALAVSQLVAQPGIIIVSAAAAHSNFLWRYGDSSRCANSTVFQSADREGIPIVRILEVVANI